MTRLALAKTIVSGTITLQGNTFTFTASSSGTATGNTVTEAKASATAASNSAAITAARASIDKILAENSAVLSDLEITSLISNNLSTTVVVYKPILLKSIATTRDGVNYTLVKDTVIKSDQWLTVPNGKTLTIANYHFTNNGYVQVGELSTDPSTAQIEYSSDFTNTGTVEVYPAGSSTIDAGVTFTNSAQGACFLNNGTCNNSGIILNSEEYTRVQNNGSFYNLAGSTIENSGTSSGFNNSRTCNNYGTILNSSNNGKQSSSYISNSGTFTNYDGSTIENRGPISTTTNTGTGTCNNYGTILNSGDYTFFLNFGTCNNYDGSTIENNGTAATLYNYVDSPNSQNLGNFTNYDGSTIENSGSGSAILNSATFNNNGTISNTGSGSYTTNSGIWTGTGTCGPAGTCQNT